jgi:two-component system sensor histidine kinase QseC
VIVRHRFSLSQRLLVALLIASFTFWAVIAWITIKDSSQDVYELFDTHLEQTALALMRVVDSSHQDPVDIRNSTEEPTLKDIFSQFPGLSERSDHADSEYPPDRKDALVSSTIDRYVNHRSIQSLQEEYEKSLSYQIWSGDGRLLFRSANAPVKPLTEVDGFSENTGKDGRVWRNYGIWNQHHDLRVVVTEAHDVRHQLIYRIALHLISPLVLGLPVLIFLLWLSIGRGLDSLSILTSEISSRKPDNLTPLDENHAPEEVRPMVLALNDLLLRFGHSLESERRFTADAAHELRTPLAAIQAQLHAARAAKSEDERMRAMAQLQLGVERGIRLVGQLLTLARLDPEQALPDAEPLSLADVAQMTCAEQAPLALQRGQALELSAEPDLPPVVGNADMLTMLFCNLVGNAIRYTPRGSHIHVDVRRHASGFLIEVNDDGPGIPVEHREHVFDRFFRVAHSDQPGTGLGLTICRRIVELHNASIELDDGAGGVGLSVKVLLPNV